MRIYSKVPLFEIASYFVVAIFGYFRLKRWLSLILVGMQFMPNAWNI